MKTTISWCDIVKSGTQTETQQIRLHYPFSSIRPPKFITSYPIRQHYSQIHQFFTCDCRIRRPDSTHTVASRGRSPQGYALEKSYAKTCTKYAQRVKSRPSVIYRALYSVINACGSEVFIPRGSSLRFQLTERLPVSPPP